MKMIRIDTKGWVRLDHVTKVWFVDDWLHFTLLSDSPDEYHTIKDKRFQDLFLEELNIKAY